MKLTLRVISGLLFIVGIIWMIVSPGFDALTAFLTGILTLLTSFLVDNKQETETLDQRNRRILLGHVENFWVKGVLEKSLHGAALLELGIKEEPEAVKYPWGIKKEGSDELLPSGKSMLEIFEQIGMGRSLLILGAPGSGKTTMLLDLARQFIERARKDENEPIPLVFNLVSWTEKQTLARWLIEQLNLLYYVPKKTALDWVSGNKLILLLDGLDEVQADSRVKCVQAINMFRKENGLTSMVVCSRSKDYTQLKVRVNLHAAIEIQPLTKEQTNAYIDLFSEKLARVRTLLTKDTVLREMSETPLLLNIMAIVYQNKDEDILLSDDMTTQHKLLFDSYITRMFNHSGRENKKHFFQGDVLRWLSWLAHNMIQHNQVPLLIERIQPDWLAQKKQIANYRWVVGLLSGLCAGLSTGIGFGINYGTRSGLISGGLIGLSVGWYSSTKSEIQTVDSLVWNLARLRFGLYAGLLIGIGSGIYNGLYTGLYDGLVFGIPVALFFGLTPKPVTQITYPGEKLSLTAKSFVFIIVIFGLAAGLLGGFVSGLLVGVLLGLYTMLVFGVFFGLLHGAGIAIFQHYSLRFVLAFNKILPWKLVPFLDYCTDLIFLRRVGGGYIFVHRLLMEHFAEMYDENNKAVTIDTL